MDSGWIPGEFCIWILVKSLVDHWLDLAPACGCNMGSGFFQGGGGALGVWNRMRHWFIGLSDYKFDKPINR